MVGQFPVGPVWLW